MSFEDDERDAKGGGYVPLQRLPLRPGVYVRAPDWLPLQSRIGGPRSGKFLRLPKSVTVALEVHGREVLAFTAREGFEWDGASRPWWACWLIPRFGPQVLLAALVHDYLYAKPTIDRQLADAVFRSLLIVCHLPRWRAWIAWAGVRLGGWRAWRRAEAALYDWRRFP